LCRPPRIAPQHFERDTTKLTRTQKKIASESKLLADLKTQYSSQPEVESSQGMGYGGRDMSNKYDKMLAEKEAYEEENFLRPNLTRKDKQLLKKVQTQGASMRFQDEFKVRFVSLSIGINQRL
jgi:U3 small nucleolar ribonucleoprotein protein LCP5